MKTRPELGSLAKTKPELGAEKDIGDKSQFRGHVWVERLDLEHLEVKALKEEPENLMREEVRALQEQQENLMKKLFREIKILRVSFEPGSRTFWHSHPNGQILYVESGRGRYGVEGEYPMEIQAGDMVVAARKKKHWHGAAPDCSMAHLAIHADSDWKEKKEVSDAEYLGLYYEAMGKGHPLVLIHAGHVHSRIWDDQFNAFAARHRVIRYDARGFGKSAPQGRESYSNIKDLYELLRFLTIDKTCLVGLSMGGRIAIEFALEHPKMVNGLVLASSSLSGHKLSETYSGKWRDIFSTAKQEGGKKAIWKYLNDSDLAPPPKRTPARKKLQEILSENRRGFLVNRDLMEWSSPPAMGRLAEIKIPTLILVGRRDAPDVLKIAEVLHENIEGSEKVGVSGAGHMINMERPEKFNQTVLDFLNKL